MNKLKSLAFVALAAFGSFAHARQVDTEWWDVDFTSPTPQVDYDGEHYGGVFFTPGELGSLTNNPSMHNVEVPYPTGWWTAKGDDESYVTNAVVTNIVNGVEEEGTNWYLHLDTQGNDLTWGNLHATNDASGVINLVDARLLLVGSDSAPDPADFDPESETDNRVQTAIFLKSELDENGETTNSVLCVYVVVDNELFTSGWKELDGVEIEDGTWHDVRVSINYKDKALPFVTVEVDGTTMHARGNAEETWWTVANPQKSNDANKVRSVSFRGTGAVDNFVGTIREQVFDTLMFQAQVYLDMQPQPVAGPGEEGNLTRYEQAEAGDIGSGKNVEFKKFKVDDYKNKIGATYALSKIELVDPADGSVSETYTYEYNKSTGRVTPSATTERIAINNSAGTFNITASTDGAVDLTNLVANVYFTSFGAYNVYAETDLDGTVSTNNIFVKPAMMPLTTNWTFAATQSGCKLQRIETFNGATATFDAATRTATVTVTIADGDFDSDTRFAKATYVAGVYEDYMAVDWDDSQAASGVYTLDGGVAKIGAVYYPTLAAAVAATPTDGTTTNIVLLANVTQTATLVVSADRDFTLDMNGLEISAPSTTGAIPLFENWGSMVLTNGTIDATGVIVVNKTDASLTVEDGTYVSGNHAFRNGDKNRSIDADGASITVNGGSITAQESCIAVKTADSTVLVTGGTLTSIDNAVISCNGTTDAGAVLDGNKVTVTGGTLVGGITSDGYIACGIFAPNDDEVFFGSNAVIQVTGGCGILARAGKVTVDGGSIATTGNATGKVGDSANAVPSAAIVFDSFADNGGLTDDAAIEVMAGTFVSDVNPVQTVLAAGDANKRVVVTGGWFSDTVAASCLADGYLCVLDADPPTAAAPYAVKAAAVQILGHAEAGTFLSIAQAQAAAAAASIADPTFVLIRPLAAETVVLATVDDTLAVQTTNTDYWAALDVETSLPDTDAVEYAVVSETVNPEVGVTRVDWTVQPTYYVAKIVDGTTTNKYATFTAAATVAMAQTPTLVVEMVANTNALEDAFAITGSLKVKAGGFLIPELLPEDRSHYLAESGPDENGVVTYTSTAYLTATFVNGDGSTLQEVDVRVGETPVPTFDFDDVEPYPPAQPGYVVHFAMTWTPALGPIDDDTVFRPNFTTNVMSYSIDYHLDGIGGAYAAFGPHWPAGYEPPEWYAVTNATIELPAPEMDGWKFLGWWTNVTGGVAYGDLVNPGVIPTGSYGTKFFYAEWAQLLEIDFMTNGVAYTNFLAADGETFAAPDDPPVPALAGWTFAFAGWSTNGLATGLLDPDDDWPQRAVEDNQTYWGLFTSNAVSYAIDVELAGGDWVVDYLPPATYAVTNDTISFPEVAREGYRFAGWTNALGEAVAGEIPAGSTGDKFFGATWVKTWSIEFYDGATLLLSTNVDNLATGYGPAADPVPAEGFEFGGWTNAVAGGAAVATADLPAATADARYDATWTATANPEVNPGDGLAKYKAEHPLETVPEPLDFNDTTEKAEIAFVAPAAGKYLLITSTSLAPGATWTEDRGSLQTVAQGQVVVLSESEKATSGAKFFKIGYEK